MDIIQDALALMMSGSGSSPVLDTVKFTVNGTFTPSVGVDGWNEVEVEVLPNLDTINITANDTYTPPAGTDGYNEIVVNVTPSLDTLNVTSNGTYTPPAGTDGYDEVVVSVSGGGGTIEPLSVNTNGVYTASGGVDGYSPVTVDVQPTLGTKSITANGTYTASSDSLDGYSSVTVNVASSATSNDSESLSYMAYKNGKTIFDVETGYYILPKMEATATAGRSTWNVHLYAPDGTDVETFACGITTTDAQIANYDFAGFGVTVNAQQTGASGRGYVKYLPSSSFLSSQTSSNNLLNYFAGNQGYIVGDIPT